MTRVLVVGEPLLELLEPSPATPWTGFGGDALNLAVYLAREAPEVDVALATAVGTDAGSHAVMAFCVEERVDVSGVRRVDGAAIGRYRVTVDGSGERTFAYERSDSPFRASLDDGGFPDDGAADVLCFSGIGMAVLRDAGRRALLAYATRVHAAGGMVVYDPNHRPALWDDADARRWTTRIAAVTDLLLASTEDGHRLLDARTPLEIARAFRALGAAEVVVTDGGQPCVVATHDIELSVDAVAPAEVVDTTAAGDAFDAAYLIARLRGASPAASAAAGHARAATVVGHRGAFAPAAET